MKVGLIFGGVSPEHEVSIKSARSFIAHKSFFAFDLINIYISKEGKFYLVDDRLSKKNEVKLSDLKGKIDIVFPLVHGPFGEDGCLQGALELFDINYCGCGVLSSALCMNKVTTKRILKSSGLPVLNFYSFSIYEWQRKKEIIIFEIQQAIKFPYFVKPSSLGSSIGVNKVYDERSLEKSIEEAFLYGDEVIVEEGKPVREIEVGIIGTGEVFLSEVGEILYETDFYNYSAKYEDDRTRLLIPANLDKNIKDDILILAKEAYHCLHCEGFARVDMFLTKDEELFINEINTIPGFTERSMFPKLFMAKGIKYENIVNMIIESGFKRRRQKYARKGEMGF